MRAANSREISIDVAPSGTSNGVAPSTGGSDDIASARGGRRARGKSALGVCYFLARQRRLEMTRTTTISRESRAPRALVTRGSRARPARAMAGPAGRGADASNPDDVRLGLTIEQVHFAKAFVLDAMTVRRPARRVLGLPAAGRAPLAPRAPPLALAHPSGPSPPVSPPQAVISRLSRDRATALHARQRTVAVAASYFWRFYLRRSFAAHEPVAVAAACFSLASKVEENPVHDHLKLIRLARDTASVVYAAESDDCFDMRDDDLLPLELRVLDALDCDLRVFDPYAPLRAIFRRRASASPRGPGGEAASGAGDPASTRDADPPEPGSIPSRGESNLGSPDALFRAAWGVVNDATVASPLCAAVSAEAAAVAAAAPRRRSWGARRRRSRRTETAWTRRARRRREGDPPGDRRGARGRAGRGAAAPERCREGGGIMRGRGDAGGDEYAGRRRFPESRREEAAAIVRRARARRGERTRGDGRMRTSGDDDAAE